MNQPADSPSTPAAVSPPAVDVASASGLPDSAGQERAEIEPSVLAALGWTPTDRWFFAVVATVLVLALGASALRLSGWGVRPVPVNRPESRRYEFQLDVNTATWVEWMQLEGIGEGLARRIVEDREANGPFATVDDVARVKGVGDTTLEKIRPWLTVTH